MIGADVRKDVRALAPTWLAAAFVIMANAFVWTPLQFRGALLAYAFGTIALGAQVIGHEYSHRTLPLLLSQPRDRRRVLATKLAVLAAMILLLAVVAVVAPVPQTSLVVGGHPPVPADLSLGDWPLLAWVAAAGLFLAPCLSMLCRGTLPAIVFTVTIPGMLGVTGEILSIAAYGSKNGAGVEAFKIAMLSWSMAAVCAVAAVATWVAFIRLEAVDGAGRAIELPLPSDERTARTGIPVLRKRHPIGALVRKELRLQQMTFVVVALYVVAWLALALVQRYALDTPIPLGALTMLYCALLTILIGSLASAEERQFGTWQWQVLLPLPLWKQWAVKAGTVLGMTVLFGVGLPLFLNYISPAGSELPRHVWPEPTFALLALAAASLYVSSLSGSGVKAMVISLPVIAGGAVIVLWAVGSLNPLAARMFAAGWGGATQRLTPDQVAIAQSMVRWTWMAAALGFVTIVLRLALANHRSADRRIVRIIGHGVGVLVTILVGAVIPAVVWAYLMSR